MRQQPTLPAHPTRNKSTAGLMANHHSLFYLILLSSLPTLRLSAFPLFCPSALLRPQRKRDKIKRRQIPCRLFIEIHSSRLEMNFLDIKKRERGVLEICWIFLVVVLSLYYFVCMCRWVGRCLLPCCNYRGKENSQTGTSNQGHCMEQTLLNRWNKRTTTRNTEIKEAKRSVETKKKNR